MDGDTTPSLADHTQFLSSQPDDVRIYTIDNIGDGDLTLGTVTITQNLSEFTVTAQPGLSIIPPLDETTFTVSYAGSSSATGTVMIPNNDSDENPFTFAIQGSG